MSAAELTRQIILIGQQIEAPESKGKRTGLKAIQRKLYTQLMKVSK